MSDRIAERSNAMHRASRVLCLVLRHKSEAAGITLNEHGWADIEELLRGVSERHPLTFEDLEEIVKTDDKNRYSFNEDKTKIYAIKANQSE